MRTKVFYDKPQEACYGCQSCSEGCPVKAISMHQNEEGFYFPVIDESKCIECNLCEKSCPTQRQVVSPLFYSTPDYVDAAWVQNLNDRLESTSGGLFYVLAQQFLNNGGVVYGAAFDPSMVVRHVRISEHTELNHLRGSKYVQSDVFGTFRAVKKDLSENTPVLYSGTPCQIAGLRTFLKKEYDHLVTVDLVCHGVPSPIIFKEHLKYIEKSRGDEIVDYKFRGKKRSGWRAYIKYIFTNHKPESNFLGGDFFAYCFYRARFNRRSCFTCDFSKSKRVGDITLSDFWNAEKVCKPLRIQRKYGFNMVMCNTVKGRELYKAVKDKIKYITLDTSIAIDGDVRLRHTEEKPYDRDSIFREYFEYGYEWLVENRGAKKSFISNIVPTWCKNLIYEIKARI